MSNSKKSTSKKGTVELTRVIIPKANYDLLDTTKINRTIITLLVKIMIKSVEMFGQLRDVIVVKNKKTGKFTIVDGQHLTKALIYLKRPIECRIVDVRNENELINLMIVLNNTSRSWKLGDYINSWAQGGNEHYLYLQNLIKGNKIQETIILMAFTLKSRSEATKIAKLGKFNLTNKQVGLRLLSYLTDCIPYLNNTRVYNQALMNLFIKTNDYNQKKMVKNLKKYGSTTIFSTKEKEIYNQLVEIYNK